MKRYEIMYRKINTTLESIQTTDSIEEVKDFIKKFNSGNSVISVLDYEEKDVIYYKSAFTSKPEKDLLNEKK